MKYLLWSAAVYALGYAVSYLVIEYDFHFKGCNICTKNDTDCSCSYLKSKLEPLMKWVQKGLERDTVYTPQAAFIIATVPLIVSGVFIVQHIVMPRHKRNCLSAILNGDHKYEEV